MLVKLRVRMTRKDKKDPDKQISEFVDYMINPEVIASVIGVPETETSLIKLINGDQILTKGTIEEIQKACKK